MVHNVSFDIHPVNSPAKDAHEDAHQAGKPATEDGDVWYESVWCAGGGVNCACGPPRRRICPLLEPLLAAVRALLAPG